METVRITELKDNSALNSLQRLDESMTKVAAHNKRMALAKERIETEYDRIIELRDRMTRGEPLVEPTASPTPGPRDMPRAEPGLARRRTVLAAEVSQILFQQRRVGATNDIQSIEFLERGQIAKRSVGKLILAGKGIGTGFLVGHDLLMTARHVLPSEAEASDIKLALDDEENYVGTPIAAKIYQLDPFRFFWEDQDLDVAIVAVASLDSTSPTLSDFGMHRILGSDNAITPGAAVSIIQHPNGEPKRIVVHNSHFVSNDESAAAHLTCWYTGDTESGSSGSPVFDAEWKVVAVHRRFVPETNEKGEILGIDGEPIKVEGATKSSLEELAKGHRIAVYANEGARTSQIIAALNDSHLTDPGMEQIRRDLLATWAGGH